MPVDAQVAALYRSRHWIRGAHFGILLYWFDLRRNLFCPTFHDDAKMGSCRTQVFVQFAKSHTVCRCFVERSQVRRSLPNAKAVSPNFIRHFDAVYLCLRQCSCRFPSVQRYQARDLLS